LDKKGRKRYTREFKREAVRLAEESELPASKVARQGSGADLMIPEHITGR